MQDDRSRGPKTAAPDDDEAWLDRTQQLSGSALLPGTVPVAGVKLVCVGGPLTGKEFPLNSVELVVGRGPDNAISLIADQSVSKRHAQLRRTPAGWAVGNLSTRNGTLVNGFELKSGEQRVLRPGDVVTFGATALMLVEPRPPESFEEDSVTRAATQTTGSARREPITHPSGAPAPELPGEAPTALGSGPIHTDPELDHAESDFENRTVLNGDLPRLPGIGDDLDAPAVHPGPPMDPDFENRTVLDRSPSMLGLPLARESATLPAGARAPVSPMQPGAKPGSPPPLPRAKPPAPGPRGQFGPPPELEVTSPNGPPEPSSPGARNPVSVVGFQRAGPTREVTNPTAFVPAVGSNWSPPTLPPGVSGEPTNPTAFAPALTGETTNPTAFVPALKTGEVTNPTAFVPALKTGEVTNPTAFVPAVGSEPATDPKASAGDSSLESTNPPDLMEAGGPASAPDFDDDDPVFNSTRQLSRPESTHTVPGISGGARQIPSRRGLRRQAEARVRRLKLAGLAVLALLVGVAPVAAFNSWRASRNREQQELRDEKSRVDAIFQQGKDLLRRGKYEEAKQRFREVHEQDTSYPVQDFIARADREAGIQAQLASAHDALERNQLGEALAVLAKVPTDSNQYEDLLKLKAAVEDRAQLRVKDARKALEAGKLEEAIRVADDILKVLPNHPESVGIRSDAQARLDSRRR